MLFLVLADDRPGMLDRRLATRPRHLDYLAGHGTALKLAGAQLDGETPCGSFFLIEAADEAAVRALVAADPFAVDGIFAEEISIRPVRPALGEWKPEV